MVKFRQKNYAIPLLAAAASKIGVGNLLVGGTTVGSMVHGSSQAKKQAEQNEELAKKQNEENQKIADQQSKDAKKMAEAIDKLAKKNPSASNQVPGILGQNSYSAISKVGKEIVNLGKVGKSILSNHKKGLIKGTMIGGAMTTGGYAADKLIQRDIKSFQNPPKQKDYSKSKLLTSAMNTGKSILKTSKEVIKEDPKTLAGSVLAGGVLTGAGYISQRKQMKDQIKGTALVKGEKSFSKAGSIMKGVKSGWNKIKSTKGSNVLSSISNFAGGGGKKGVSSFGESLTELGNKHGSTIAQKAGKFIQNNPKTALAASVPVGFGIMDATWGTGQKAVKKVAEKLDKNAFAYENSQNKQIN